MPEDVLVCPLCGSDRSRPFDHCTTSVSHYYGVVLALPYPATQSGPSIQPEWPIGCWCSPDLWSQQLTRLFPKLAWQEIG